MVQFRWNIDKNLHLKMDSTRAVCFEDIVTAIENGFLLDDIEHSNATKSSHQRIYIVLHDNYVYGVHMFKMKAEYF